MLQDVKFEKVDAQNTRIVRRNSKTLVVRHNIERCLQAYLDWLEGKFIQDAFYFFTPDEREFILTGITPQEWARLFGEDND